MKIVKGNYNEAKVFTDVVDEVCDYSGSPAHLGRSLAQLVRASAHLIQSAFWRMQIADRPIYYLLFILTFGIEVGYMNEPIKMISKR